MCPRNPPGPNAPSFDPETLPPKLRAVFDSARRLAAIREEMIMCANTIKALKRTSGNKLEAGEHGAQHAE